MLLSSPLNHHDDVTPVTQPSVNLGLNINKSISNDLWSCHRVYNYLNHGYSDSSDRDDTNALTQLPNLIWATLPSAKKSQTDTPKGAAEAREPSQATSHAEQKVPGPPNPAWLQRFAPSWAQAQNKPTQAPALRHHGWCVDPGALATTRQRT